MKKLLFFYSIILFLSISLRSDTIAAAIKTAASRAARTLKQKFGNIETPETLKLFMEQQGRARQVNPIEIPKQQKSFSRVTRWPISMNKPQKSSFQTISQTQPLAEQNARNFVPLSQETFAEIFGTKQPKQDTSQEEKKSISPEQEPSSSSEKETSISQEQTIPEKQAIPEDQNITAPEKQNLSDSATNKIWLQEKIDQITNILQESINTIMKEINIYDNPFLSRIFPGKLSTLKKQKDSINKQIEQLNQAKKSLEPVLKSVEDDNNNEKTVLQSSLQAVMEKIATMPTLEFLDPSKAEVIESHKKDIREKLPTMATASF